MKKTFKNLIVFYLPLLIWIGLIWHFSSLENVRTGTNFVFWEIFLRKLGHAAEFFVLGFLFFRLFSQNEKNSLRKSFILAITLTFFIALLDEIHQYFVSGREGRFMDVIFDSLGAYIGLYVFNWKKKINSISMFLAILILFASLVFYDAWENVLVYGKYFHENKQESNDIEIIPEKKDVMAQENEDKVEGVEIDEIEEDEIAPTKFLIKNVPFISQAPFAVWDEIHEESCEEASIIMVEYFKNGKSLSPELAEQEIQKLVAYQEKTTGDFRDTNAKETAALASDFYGLDLKVVYDFSLDDIKAQISRGNPVIIPAAGRELGNPFFTPPGPLYHNLVIIGYDAKNFITNDPGTKRGESFIYDQNILFSAIHDFPGDKEDILKGRKAMLVLK